MKALVVLLAVLALVWLLTRSRGRRDGAPPSAGAKSSPPTGSAGRPALQACAQCGVYLPQEDALPGRGGAFCSVEHRATFERAHPT